MASLNIDRFELQLPASLGGRKHSIMRLLRAELSRKSWPSGALGQLQVPACSVNSQATNLAIARALADGLFNAALQALTNSGRAKSDRAAAQTTPKPRLQ